MAKMETTTVSDAATATKIAWALEHGKDPDQCCRVCQQPSRVAAVHRPNTPGKTLSSGGTVIDCKRDGMGRWSVGAVLAAQVSNNTEEAKCFPIGKD